jgi:hypothetical protein
VSTVLDRYERQATILPMRRLRAPEDFVAAAVDEKRTWKQIERAIREGGDPTALAGGIAGLELTPPIANETLVTGTATEQAIFPTARTAIAATPRAPVLYRLFAAGTSTTAATPGTYTLSGRVGTANTAPLIGATGGGGPVSATGNAIFGGVSAAVDFSAASALWIGVTHATSTTNTWTAQFVGWGSWN